MGIFDELPLPPEKYVKLRGKQFLQEYGHTIQGLKSVWWNLWSCPKIPRTIGGKLFFESMERFTSGIEDGVVLKHVEKHGGWWEVGTNINFEGKGFLSQQKTRVNRVTSWEDSRVGETLYHLGKHFLIEFLGHGKKFGTWNVVRAVFVSSIAVAAVSHIALSVSLGSEASFASRALDLLEALARVLISVMQVCTGGCAGLDSEACGAVYVL
ncbi:hypothetical protein TSUD_386460 [Trifolium subterraneum]|uniref:Uncharacterized protein n=1 Tax=Trifolium subterraneum TaxID=3900 RepID=A0A2Z6MQ29_TRISU|nr:hypothetical protein TSUD_386460 [Trifolium subterraneum]